MLLHRIKYSLIILCICSFTFVNGQGLVSIVNQTVVVSPSHTVTNGTSIVVSGKVKNVGGATISDFVHVNLAIDTSSTNVPKYHLRSTTSYFKAAFAPDSTFDFTVQDVASVANAYKGGGGGTVIIIWATVVAPTNSITTADSATTKIYLLGVPIGIHELINFENSPITFKNPTSESIKLNYDDAIYTEVELCDASGKWMSRSKDKTININELPKGLYLLKFWNDKTKHNVIKKIIIE